MSHPWPLPWSLQGAGPGEAVTCPLLGCRAKAGCLGDALLLPGKLLASGVGRGMCGDEVGRRQGLAPRKPVQDSKSGALDAPPRFHVLLNPRIYGCR